MLKIRYILILLLCLLLVPGVLAAMSTLYSQAGADSGTVMKGKAFTVTASGWSGSCNSAYLDFSQCAVCSVTEEEQTKSITGQSSVTWTTVTTTDTASAQKVTVTVSGGCSGESGDTSSFDSVLPPAITINSYSPTSYSDPSGSSTINLNFRNSGETVAKDVGITLSLPSGVTNSSGSKTQTESTIDPDENWGTSWTVSFGTISSSTNIYIYITPSNADSRTVTIPISITSGPGGGPSGGPSGTFAPPEEEGPQNKSRKFNLVPGVGLRNNTKLQAALEKVMAKGKLSDQALENLMRLSASITSDLEVNKYMESSETKSEIKLTFKYKGQKRVKNLVLHEKIPKAFAQSVSDITVSAPGATYEIAEQDPEYVFLYPDVDPDQSLTITYSVSSEVDLSVLDQTETVVYAESYEDLAPGVCTSGEMRCLGDDLQECSQDGTQWTTIQTCQYGCTNGQCESAFPVIDLQTMLMIGGAAVVVIIIVILVIVGFGRKKKSKLRLPKSMPEMKMRPNFP